MTSSPALTELPDEALHGEVKRLAGRSNTLLAELLAHLAEVEARGIHRERACASLYAYCVYELRMSEDEAQRRCRAARLTRQFPALLPMLTEAAIHLTGILLIGPHLTADNHDELLKRVRFRTKREIERLIAELSAPPPAPARIEPLDEDASGVGEFAFDVAAPPRRRNTWAAYVRSLAGHVRAPVRHRRWPGATGSAPGVGRRSDGKRAARRQRRARGFSSAAAPDEGRTPLPAAVHRGPGLRRLAGGGRRALAALGAASRRR